MKPDIKQIKADGFSSNGVPVWNGSKFVYNAGISGLTVDPTSVLNIDDNMFFGDGSDGAVTISSGTTTLTRDMYYSNLTLNGTGVLSTAGYRVFVNGILDITAAAAGAIKCTNGSLGTTMTAAPAAASGSAATTGNGSTGGVGGAGQMGGQGGNGGTGGAGSTGTGGASASAATLSTGVWRRIATDLLTFGTAFKAGSAGCAGSAGGGDGTHSSGAGASSSSGSGILQICARTINRGTGTPAAAIICQGATGANGSNGTTGTVGGGGGAGGGGGGWIVLLYRYLTGATATNCFDVSGGLGGSGGTGTNLGGYAGGNGAGGRVSLFNLSTGILSDNFFGTSVPKTSAVGPATTTAGVSPATLSLAQLSL